MRRSCPALVLAAMLAWPAPAQAAPRRIPLWPTEVSRVAAPLYPGPVIEARADRSDERGRLRAIQELDAFTTPAIVRHLVHALDDPSTQVRRETLRICYERAVLACVPAAVQHWRDGRESTLRVAALKVIALQPTGERAALLRDALRDPGESVRAQAAEFLGWAALTETERERAQAALLAKLGDVSALVRRHATDSLGLLGGPEATLAVARLLEDPEPAVQVAAAAALGRLHDDRAVPSLRRALLAPNEPLVIKAIVVGLAQLGGDAVEAELLALLDDPPTGTDAALVADAIGRRARAGKALIEGLVARLREPAQRDAAHDALRMLGARAHAELQSVRKRGVEPPLRATIDALLAEPGTSIAPRASWPADDDRSGWRRRLERGGFDERLAAAAELGKRSPAWLSAAIAGAIGDDASVDVSRAWLVAAATSARALTTDDLVAWAKILGWAYDRRASPSDRCLAIAASSSAGGRAKRWVARQLEPLRDDARSEVRACVVLASARLGAIDAAADGLVDRSARVRVAAALALADASVALPDLVASRLAVLRARDPIGQVRTAAFYATTRRARDRSPRDAASRAPAERPVAWVQTLAPEFPWAEAEELVALSVPPDGGPGVVWAPALTHGALRWCWIPGLAGAEIADRP